MLVINQASASRASASHFWYIPRHINLGEAAPKENQTLMTLVKKLLGLILLMSAVVAVGIPPVLGLLVRDRIHQLLAPLAQSEGLRVEILDTRGRWFRSEFALQISSEIFSDDGLTRTSLPAIVHVTHGPVIWHLYDSLFALADLQLTPDNSRPAKPDTHFSGSAMVKIDSDLRLTIRAITGFTAFAGSHWLEGQANWPLGASTDNWRVLLSQMDLALTIDADAEALAASPAADALNVYQRQGWSRLSNNRALTYITLQYGDLDINGTVMPVGIFFGQP